MASKRLFALAGAVACGSVVLSGCSSGPTRPASVTKPASTRAAPTTPSSPTTTASSNALSPPGPNILSPATIIF